MDFKDFEKTGVYRIINKINGRVYYGSTTVSFKKRINHHLTTLRNGNHKNRHLQHAFNKYGDDNFSFEIVEILEKNNCRKSEQKYLDSCEGNCYNINYNSETPPLNDEIRKVRSLTAKRLIESNDNFGFEKGNTPWNKGLTKEEFDYSYLNVPKTITEAVIESREVRTEYNRYKLPSIEVYSLEDELLGTWRSAKDLEEDSLRDSFILKKYIICKKRARKTKPIHYLSSKHINMCAKGIIETYKSLKFKFV